MNRCMTDQSTHKLLDKLERERLILAKKAKKMAPWFISAPFLLSIAGGFSGIPGFAVLMTFFWTTLMSFGIYTAIKHSRFKKIKHKFKEALVDDYMALYHPDMVYYYYPKKQQVKNILRRYNLARADRYKEEDVIKGLYGNTEYYLSEIRLQRKSDKNYVTTFKGLLFKIKKKGVNYKKARIQTKAGILNKIFKTYSKNEEFGFHYYAHDEREFNEEFSNLFPFIQHLNSKCKDLRIHIEGDEITIMMDSKMKFLDEPSINTNDTLRNYEYNASFTKQLNTLLYIVEAFENNEDQETIDEKLELKVLEEEKIELRDKN